MGDRYNATPRKDARAAGEKLYNTGIPCKHGHIADRHTISGVCVTCSNIAKKRWCNDNKDRRRDQSRASSRRKNLPLPTRPESGKCDCCHKPLARSRLDHDHEDHTFRGWLCNKCNTGIGLLGDSLEGVILAATYLMRHKQDQRKNTPNDNSFRVVPHQDSEDYAIS